MTGITTVLSLLSGVALFLFGMTLMGEGLQRVAGKSLERTLYKLTSTPIRGVMLGAVVTAVIQSSSATTVMVVGFVNSGMMKVAQAIGVIMGANIGTSITGWILCLSYIDGSSGIATLLSTATISAIVAIIGILFKKFMKRSIYHNIGDIMLGFAILMVGMQTMSGAVSPLKENAHFVNMLTMFTNPFVGILVGILFTAVLQSASASVGILQALSMTGAITFASAYPIILGIGIGAAVPVLMSAIGTNNNGKRTALVYLVNDVLGMMIWGSIFYLAHAIVHFDFMGLSMTPLTIAALNSVYRLLTVMALFPFTKYIEKLVFLLVKDSAEDMEEQADFDLLEERFLVYPELAISQCHKAMNGMARTADKNLKRAFAMVREYSDTELEKVEKKEQLLDKYEDKLGTYLMQMTRQRMNTAETRQVSKFLHSITDFERLGDHAVNIAYVAQRLMEEKIIFSAFAAEEIRIVIRAVETLIHMTCEAFQSDDIEKARSVEPLCEWVDSLCDAMKSHHVSRLQKGQCRIEQGLVFHDLINNFERIAAHCSNIAIAVVEGEGSDFDPHAYLDDVKKNKDEDYLNQYQAYKEEFSLDEVEKAEQEDEAFLKIDKKEEKKHKEKADKKKKKKEKDKKEK